MSERRGGEGPSSDLVLIGLTLLASVVALGLLVSRSDFPPGADPGHLLGLSYAFEGNGPEGPLKYPPALPFAMLVVRRLSGTETAWLFHLVKAFGVLLLLFEALGLGAYAGAIAGRRAAVWTFLLAALNPNAWNQLLWGGYAQFAGVGAGASALAFLHRGLAAPPAEGNGYRLAAALLFGGVALSHLYSVPFFVGAAVCLSVIRVLRSSTGVAVVSRALGVALLSAVIAVPAAPAYAHIVRAVEVPPWDAQIHFQSYKVAFAEVAQGIYFHPAVNGLMLLAFSLTLATGRKTRPQWPQSLLPCFLPLVAGSFVVLVLTPPLHLARAGTFVCYGLVILMGVSLGQRQCKFPCALVLVLTVTPLISYRDLVAQHSRYAPLSLMEAEAMRDLGRAAQGRTWVVSPSPNLDGWWFQGLTGRSTLIGDRLRWYMYTEERRRSIDAQTMLHASQVLDGEALKLLQDPGKTSLWVHDREEYYPLLQLRVVSARESGPVVTEAEGNAEGFRIRWRAETDLRIVIEPFPGVRARRVVHRDRRLTFDLEFLYEPFRSRGMARRVELDLRPLSSEKLVIESKENRVQIRALRERPLGLDVHARVAGLTPSSWRSRSREELMDRWDVTHVVVRDHPDSASLFEDKRIFLSLWKVGRLSAYRVRRE